MSWEREERELRELAQDLLQAATSQKHACVREWHGDRGEHSDGLSAAPTSTMSTTTSNNISPHNELADLNDEDDAPRLRSRCCTPEQVVEEHSFELIESPDDRVGHGALLRDALFFEESSGQTSGSLASGKKKKKRSKRVSELVQYHAARNR